MHKIFPCPAWMADGSSLPRGSAGTCSPIVQPWTETWRSGGQATVLQIPFPSIPLADFFKFNFNFQSHEGLRCLLSLIFLTSHHPGLLQVGIFFSVWELLWLLAVVQLLQAVAQLGFCSRAPPQPSQLGERGSVTHRTWASSLAWLPFLTSGFLHVKSSAEVKEN